MKSSGRRTREEVREQAIRAALSRFAASGYEATAIQSIAEDVSMSKQALMHHFPTKEHLRTGVYEKMADHFVAAVPFFLEGINDDCPTVEVLDVFAAAFENNPDISRFLIRELLDNPTHAVAWLWERSAPFLDLAEDASDRTVNRDPAAHAIACGALMLTNATFFRSVDEPWRDRIRNASSLLLKRGSDPAFSWKLEDKADVDDPRAAADDSAATQGCNEAADRPIRASAAEGPSATPAPKSVGEDS